MTSFGAKPVLRRDIVTTDIWFQNSSEICEYLESSCDGQMNYFNLNGKVKKNECLNTFLNMFQIRLLFSLENIYVIVENAYS